MANDGSGWLTISVDLEMPVETRARGEQRALEVAARRLLAKFEEHELAAAWALADPAHSAATEAILAAGRGHEIAILGDRAWVGRGAGRTRFSRELARRVDKARAANIPIATLALQGVELDDHLDLLVRHRIVVLRDAEVTESSVNNGRPSSRWSRYGVWRPLISCRIPCDRPWWQGGAALAVRQSLRRAAQAGGFAHVIIDGPQLIEAGESGFAAVRTLLRETQKRQLRKQLGVATLSEVGNRMMRRHAAAPLRSILRPAA